jgi:hypothetical protein
LPGPRPHDPADAPKDIEKSQLKTLLAHSGPEKRNQVFDEIS